MVKFELKLQTFLDDFKSDFSLLPIFTKPELTTVRLIESDMMTCHV